MRDLAEVYTHEREVAAMVDLVQDSSCDTSEDTTFLEPACGSGNFLVEILRRKLALIRFASADSPAQYEYRIIRALASIYGIDICEDNVREARHRLLDAVREHYYSDANTIEPSDGFVSAALAVLTTNIVRADFLAHASTTEVVDYQPVGDERFLRTWSVLDDSMPLEMQPSLFFQTVTPKRDEVAVHYTDLATTPEPTRQEVSGMEPRIA